MHASLRISLMTASLFSTALGKIVFVSVTGRGFGPSNIVANVGDEIKISFTSGTASFTQSSLDQPCVSSGGIDSGIKTIPSGQGPQEFTFTLQTSTPLFFFNSAPPVQNKCGSGFVAAINASSQQFSQFQTNAKASSQDPPVQATSQATSPNPPVLTQIITSDLPNVSSNLNFPDSELTSISYNPVFVTGNEKISIASATDTSILPSSSSRSSSLSSPLVTTASAPDILAPTLTVPNGATVTLGLPVPSNSPSSLSPTSTHEMSGPGQTSQSVTSANQKSGHNNTQIFGIVFGIVLGVFMLSAGVVALIVIKRRRARATLLPRTHNRYSDIDGPVIFNIIRRAIRSIQGVPSRLAGVLFPRGWGWIHLGKNEERTVTPYMTKVSLDPPVFESEARAVHTAPAEPAEPAQVRPPSEATLVQSAPGTEISDQSDESYLSLVVNIPRSEKTKDGTDTSQRRIDIETYPIVLATTSGNGHLQKPFPSPPSDLDDSYSKSLTSQSGSL